MSTHNIGFYEDLTKIIFELSSNIIKYAPYFFCWGDSSKSLSVKLNVQAVQSIDWWPMLKRIIHVPDFVILSEVYKLIMF